MAAPQGVYTDARRILLGNISTGDTPVVASDDLELTYFKIGEGGQTAGEPDNPDPGKIDIEANVPVGAAALITDEVFFKKFFGIGDVTDGNDGVTTCVCFVAGGEANDDGLGNSPVFYEIGIFDKLDRMIAYGTFPGETKFLNGTLLHTIVITE